MLRARCAYAVFFEPEPASGPADSGGSRLPCPNPYVMEPPLSIEGDLPAGERLAFSLIIFGQANDYLPYIVYAFKTMGEMGLGRRVDGRRGQFELEEIWLRDKQIYSDNSDQLSKVSLSRLELNDYKNDDRPAHLRLEFLTPLRVKHRNRFSVELPFHVLVRALLRRISSLEEYFGSGRPELDYSALAARALEVRMVENHLAWLDWSRYSNRQEKKMLLGGLVGQVVYGGDLSEYAPLLRYGALVHIGKQTSFGLGQYKLVEKR